MPKRLVRKKQFVDKHREVPGVDGGTYDPDNVKHLSPREHMAVHGNLRTRPEDYEQLKGLVDDRNQLMKLKTKMENQLRASKRRTDVVPSVTIKYLETQLDGIGAEVKNRTNLLIKMLKDLREKDKLIDASLNVGCLGPVTAAYLAVYVDLGKADHASSLWKYAGIHIASHERYKKGEKGGGNKSLRTALRNMADSVMKHKSSPYRRIYDQVKGRLEVSDKITKSRNGQGKLIDCAWKAVKPGHRHCTALRAVMKHVLADYWFVGRTILGLPTNPVYAEAILGKNGHKTIDPKTRGWEF